MVEHLRCGDYARAIIPSRGVIEVMTDGPIAPRQFLLGCWLENDCRQNIKYCKGSSTRRPLPVKTCGVGEGGLQLHEFCFEREVFLVRSNSTQPEGT
jgi:hypothetical protein